MGGGTYSCHRAVAREEAVRAAAKGEGTLKGLGLGRGLGPEALVLAWW